MRKLFSILGLVLTCALAQAAAVNWTNYVPNIQVATNANVANQLQLGTTFTDGHLWPNAPDGTTPWYLEHTVPHTGGNLFELVDPLGPYFAITWLWEIQGADLLLTGDARVQGTVRAGGLVSTNAATVNNLVATNGVVTGGLTNTSVSQLQGAVTANQVTSTNVITAQAGINTAGTTNTGVTVHTPTAIQTLAAGTVIAWDSSTERVVSSGGAVTLTGTPTIQTNGVPDGALITIRGTSDVNTVTLQDYRLLTGTCIAMEMGNVTLMNGSEIRFQWSAANQKWQQVAFSANSSQNHKFANITVETNIVVGVGSIAAPGYSFIGNTGSGFYISGGTLGMAYNGTRVFQSSAALLEVDLPLFLGSATQLRGGTAEMQLGADAASPASQTIKSCDGVGSDKVGSNLTLEGGQSTGTGTAGGVAIATGLTGEASASTVNAYSTRAWYHPKFVALTHATATEIQKFSLPANKILGGEMIVTIYATNSTPHAQVITSRLLFQAAAIGTTTYPTVDATNGTQGGDGGTLTITGYTAVDNGDNTFSIKANVSSDLVTPIERAKVVVTALNGNAAVTITDP